MTDSLLTNHTFADLQVGDTASLTRVAGDKDIDLLAAMAGGNRLAPGGATAKATTLFNDIVANGLWTGALVSRVIGTRLPGPGTIYLGQDFRFVKPVVDGDTITATVRVVQKYPDNRTVALETICSNQKAEYVLTGTAMVIAPDKSIEWTEGAPSVSLPDTKRASRYEGFVAEAHGLPPVRAAIVHPCSAGAILAAVEVRQKGLFDPLLVGPEAKIRAAAEAAGIDLGDMAIEDVPHSHAAAARAVELAVGRAVSVLVKGSLHTDELLGAVIATGSGLRTERRISHVFAFDVPAYGKPLIVTDAAINIQPTLDQKRDICQNAIDLLRTLGVDEPRVAVLAAVETVNAKMPSTLDAAGRVDGPLAFDNAIDLDAAKTKGIVSPVAGEADILLVPDLEAGNMLAKQLIYFAGATAAGIVLGARVPIVLTSRSDPLSARIASATLARLLVARNQVPGAGAIS
jgi:phosphate acetyltransferase